MNGIEDRLRDAFGAAAETVRPESVAGLADRLRLGKRRHVVALAAAAAVAVVIVGASILTPLALAGGHGAPYRPARPAATSPAAPASPSRLASPSSAGALTVPNVIGMQEGQAMLILSGGGLNVAVVGQGDSSAAAGTVLAQTPAAGARVPAGAEIAVYVAVATGSSPTPAPGASG